MAELSIFVDESGHFDIHSKVSPYYIVSFVFHNQSDSIEENLQAMDVHLHNLGYPGHCIHTEPIIRGEEVYETMSLEDRRKLFDTISHFTRKSPIRGKTFFYEKKHFSDKLSLISKMAKDISLFCNQNMGYFNQFDSIKLYYDNGQGEITLALTSSLSTVLPQITFRKVSPRNYRLFQVADFICTLELINKKYEKNGRLSNSEHFFFRNYVEFRKKYLPILNKILFWIKDSTIIFLMMVEAFSKETMRIFSVAGVSVRCPQSPLTCGRCIWCSSCLKTNGSHMRLCKNEQVEHK